MSRTVVRNGTVIMGGLKGTHRADVAIEGATIVEIGQVRVSAGDLEIDAEGCWVLPGLVQTHVHLCQTLFRGVAEDLDVMQWLDRWIWPLEQHLDYEAASASARWGVAQLLLSGTTTFNSMETAFHTDAAFAAATDLGARAVIGKALMDRREPGTVLLGEGTAEAWRELEDLVSRWHGSADGRIMASVAPRAPSAATDTLWRKAAELARQRGLVIHTHVNENQSQAALVAGSNEARDVQVLQSYGALGPRTVLAHCVWLSQEERDLLASTQTSVAHCPSANLKLGSGVALVPELLAEGVNVSLGTDGAACNNGLDGFDEMRMAALIHRPRCGPEVLPADRVLTMGTRDGARALGLGDRLGVLAVGQLADIAVVATPEAAHEAEAGRAATHLIFAGGERRVRHVLVNGRAVVANGELTHGSLSQIEAEAFLARDRVLGRHKAAG